MRKAIILPALAAFVLLLLSGCGASTRTARLEVATQLTKSYAPTVSPEEVTVRQLGAAGPREYDYLGSVLVYDPGNAVVVPLDSAMFLARKAVSDAGGNFLYIMRMEAPGGIVRSNYEIFGKMLLATDFSPLTEASPLYEPIREPGKRYVYLERRDRSSMPEHTFYLSGGYGRIMTPLELSPSMTILYGSVENGWFVNGGYSYTITGSGWGAGGYFSSFATRFFIRLRSGEKEGEGIYDLRQRQVGPSVSWSGMVMKNWILSLRLGVGYSWETDTYIPDSVDNPYAFYDNLYGIGQSFNAEFSYRFSSRISAGVLLGESFSGVWGTDTATGRSYGNCFAVLSAGPILKFTL